ncbi:MAG: hypothetical protein IJ272_08630 [Clostridia bacterium]|nr:hypothetical protein [Clostridia bacterium]
MEKEKLETKRKKNKNINNNKKTNIKTYLRDFLLFVDKNLIKTIGILTVLSILLIAICISPMVSSAASVECEGACMDGITLLSDYTSKIQILLFTLVAGIVPYIYISVVGFVGYVLNEVSNIAFLIKGYGYLGGIGAGIIPLILNVVTICIVTALAIYVCRTVTVGYRISSLKNMNFTNFRIKVYEILRMDAKTEALTKKKEDKLNKLQDKKENLNYLQILNTAIVVCIIQFISVLIQHILM